VQTDHSPGYAFTSRMTVHYWPVVPLFGLLDAALPESPGFDCGARLNDTLAGNGDEVIESGH
jgi:hypothetical protein